MLFSEDKSNQKVSPNPPKQNINDNPSPNTASANSKFSEAEVIDYEEVK